MVWVRYTWNLQSLLVDVQKPAGYHFRSVRPDELNTAIDIVLAAYRSDRVWGNQIIEIEKRMAERITSTLGADDTDYIAAEFGGCLVAISGLAKQHWTAQNLLTGICVLLDHQRKGLGRCMLALSLSRLSEMGLSEARVYTEAGSVADRKIYSLFGSVREEGVEYPGVLRPSSIVKQ